jgi:hypothetical protein
MKHSRTPKLKDVLVMQMKHLFLQSDYPADGFLPSSPGPALMPTRLSQSLFPLPPPFPVTWGLILNIIHTLFVPPFRLDVDLLGLGPEIDELVASKS